MKEPVGIPRLKSLDLFCGAGGIAEGFRQAGFECLYGNDRDSAAVATFRLNHPSAIADDRSIESIDAAKIRRSLNIRKGGLDALVGGPPCQGFSVNAPGRFLEDPRNALFTHYIRFIEEFRPKTLMFENVPDILSLADGAIFEEIVARGKQKTLSTFPQARRDRLDVRNRNHGRCSGRIDGWWGRPNATHPH